MGFFNNLFSSRSDRRQDKYASVVQRTAAMLRQREANRLAKKHGLRILDLTWEDAGRDKGSCVGPNISDMTIQVKDGQHVACMPVIRYPNFSDKTADVSIDDLFVRVGNEKGRRRTFHGLGRRGRRQGGKCRLVAAVLDAA